MAVPCPRLWGYTINGKSIQCILFVSPCSLISHVFCQLFYHTKKISVEDPYCEGQKVMGQTSHTLGTLLPGSLEDKLFCGYFGVSAEVAVEAWEMMEELDCFPHCLSFSIICGRLHLCNCTQQMAVRFCQLWGGVTKRRLKNISGLWSRQSLIWREWWWVDCACVALSINTTHSPSLLDSIWKQEGERCWKRLIAVCLRHWLLCG